MMLNTMNSRRLAAILFAVTMTLSLALSTNAQSKKDLERAQKFAQLGNQAYDKKDYRLAIRNYAEALKIAPIAPAIHFWKGKAHFNLDQYEDAYNELTMALSQGHDAFAVYEIRYYVNYMLKKPDDALYDAGEAVRLDTGKTFARTVLYNFVMGDIYRDRKEFEVSNRFYKFGAQLDPKSPDIYYWVSLNHKDLGQASEAGLACVEALKRKTKFELECSLSAADMYYGARKYDEAAELYEKVLTLKPDSSDVYVTLSDMYRNENRFDLAIMTLRRANKQYPDDPVFLSNLAWNYSLADRAAEAVEAATQAIALAPGEASAYTNRCRAYIELQKLDLATASCNAALKIVPGDGETMLYLGRIYEAQRQNAKATDAFRKAVDGLLKFTRENPNYSDGFYLLGNTYFKLLRFNDAIEAYKKCLALAPRFARARFTLGVSYLEKGNKQLAMEQYNLLLSIDESMAEKLKAEIDR